MGLRVRRICLRKRRDVPHHVDHPVQRTGRPRYSRGFRLATQLQCESWACPQRFTTADQRAQSKSARGGTARRITHRRPGTLVFSPSKEISLYLRPAFSQAGVLTKNGYLRLDPAALLISCNLSGILLARFGRPELQNCIEGLEQYAYSYEEAGDQAQELRRLFALARAGQTDFAHMSGAVGRQQQNPQSQHHSRETSTQPVHTQQQSAGLGDSMYVDTRPF